MRKQKQCQSEKFHLQEYLSNFKPTFKSLDYPKKRLYYQILASPCLCKLLFLCGWLLSHSIWKSEFSSRKHSQNHSRRYIHISLASLFDCFLKNILMVPVLAKSGQKGGQTLLEDIKTHKKKSFYRMLMFFIFYTEKNFFWVPFSKIKIQLQQNVREQTKSRPESLVPSVLVMTDILEGFLGKVDSLVRGETVLYWGRAVCAQHSWLNHGISNWNLEQALFGWGFSSSNSHYFSLEMSLI